MMFSIRQITIWFLVIMQIGMEVSALPSRSHVHPLYSTHPQFFAGSPSAGLKDEQMALPDITQSPSLLPLIAWSIPAKGLDEQAIRKHYQKGIAPWVKLNPTQLATAKIISAANYPLIILDNQGGNWPYYLSSKKWTLSNESSNASPLRLEGFTIAANELRQNIKQFKQQNIKPAAIWFDYEGPPILSDRQEVLSSEDRHMLPSASLSTEEHWNSYRRQLWLQLMSTYVAAPVLESWPDIPFTNWINTLSGPVFSVQSWSNWQHPNYGNHLFTATNPVAYAIDTAFLSVWDDHTEFTQHNIDQSYMHVMLRQVSADGWQRQNRAPWKNAMVWVSRWVPDEGYNAAPIMSREWYREALRHLWLRNIDAMGVFNPLLKGYEQLSQIEIADAQQIFAEIQPWAQVLQQGTAMNFNIPPPQCDCALWSGTKSANTAIIRARSLGKKNHHFHVKLWNNADIILDAPTTGHTYTIHRLKYGIKVQ